MFISFAVRPALLDEIAQRYCSNKANQTVNRSVAIRQTATLALTVRLKPLTLVGAFIYLDNRDHLPTSFSVRPVASYAPKLFWPSNEPTPTVALIVYAGCRVGHLADRRVRQIARALFRTLPSGFAFWGALGLYGQPKLDQAADGFRAGNIIRRGPSFDGDNSFRIKPGRDRLRIPLTRRPAFGLSAHSFDLLGHFALCTKCGPKGSGEAASFRSEISAVSLTPAFP